MRITSDQALTIAHLYSSEVSVKKIDVGPVVSVQAEGSVVSFHIQPNGDYTRYTVAEGFEGTQTLDALLAEKSQARLEDRIHNG